jgi:hypothetical protein
MRAHDRPRSEFDASVPFGDAHKGSRSLFNPNATGRVRARLLFASCDNALKAGRTNSTFLVNGCRLSASEMLEIVAYARRHGYLS